MVVPVQIHKIVAWGSATRRRVDLGVAAHFGRTLSPSDDEPGAPNAAVLSDRMWKRRYQSDPGVIGRAVTISGDVYVIAGVMPPDFEFHYSDAEL